MANMTDTERRALPGVKRSFYPECSGDVMVVLKPYYLFSPPLLSMNPDKLPTYRTSHGTPHAYDTHVPLLVMGPRIKPGQRAASPRKRWPASSPSAACAAPQQRGLSGAGGVVQEMM